MGSSVESMIAGKATRLLSSRSLEQALWLVAIVCFGTLIVAVSSALRAKHQAQEITAAPTLDFAQTKTTTLPSEKRNAPFVNSIVLGSGSEAGQVIGRIEIPALRLSVPITSGVETSSLIRGVGHVDGTAMPGGLGTMVLAGHRDTYLRPLEHVAKGMEILVADRNGTYRFLVDRWEIVFPEQVEAVAIRSRPELAMVTCYPFHFIGPAPKRFVVHAHLVSLVPDLAHRF